MYKRIKITCCIVLSSTILLHYPLITGQQVNNNNIGLSFGIIKNTILDRYYSPQIYSNASMSPFNLNFYRQTSKNIHIANFHMNNSILNTINELPFYQYNYLETTNGILTYEFYTRITDISNINMVLYAGIGNISHGAKRVIRFYNYLNPLQNYVDSVFNAYNIAAISLHANILMKIGLGTSHMFLVKAGFPFLSNVTRPYHYNPRLDSDDLLWRWRSLVDYKGFSGRFMYSLKIKDWISVRANYQVLYFLDNNPDMLKSLQQQWDIGAQYIF